MKQKIKVKVLKAFFINGRHEIGEELELDEDLVKALGDKYVKVLSEPKKEKVPKQEIAEVKTNKKKK